MVKWVGKLLGYLTSRRGENRDYLNLLYAARYLKNGGKLTRDEYCMKVLKQGYRHGDMNDGELFETALSLLATEIDEPLGKDRRPTPKTYKTVGSYSEPVLPVANSYQLGKERRQGERTTALTSRFLSRT